MLRHKIQRFDPTKNIFFRLGINRLLVTRIAVNAINKNLATLIVVIILKANFCIRANQIKARYVST
jgi:hypothetical protein